MSRLGEHGQWQNGAWVTKSPYGTTAIPHPLSDWDKTMYERENWQWAKRFSDNPGTDIEVPPLPERSIRGIYGLGQEGPDRTNYLPYPEACSTSMLEIMGWIVVGMTATAIGVAVGKA